VGSLGSLRGAPARRVTRPTSVVAFVNSGPRDPIATHRHRNWGGTEISKVPA
jgi:hypothetical protein